MKSKVLSSLMVASLIMNSVQSAAQAVDPGHAKKPSPVIGIGIKPITQADTVKAQGGTVDDGEGDGDKPQKPPIKTNGPTIGTEKLPDDSVLAGISCPLLDSDKTTKDILAVADTLAKNLSSFNTSCSNDQKNTAELSNMQASLKGVMDAGKALGDIVNKPLDPAKSPDLQANAEKLIKSIDAFSKAISNNSILNENCAKNMMNSTDLVMGLNDLMQAATPIVLKVLSAVPGFEPAIPFVLGVSAAGNVAKAIGKLQTQDSLKIDDPKVRSALLQTICEYTRVVQRVNSLRAARMGKLEEATSHLAQITNFNKQISLKIPAEIVKSIQSGNQVKNDLARVTKQAEDDQLIIDDLKQNIEGSEDSAYICSVVKGALDSLAGANLKSMLTVENLNKAIANPKFTDLAKKVSISSLLAAEQTLRLQIRKTSTTTNPNICAQNSKTYIVVVSKITANAKDIAKNSDLNIDMKIQNMSDPVTKGILANKASADKESERRQILIASTGGMNNIEIDRDLRAIKLALFGARPSTNSVANLFGIATGGKSPVESWYSNVDSSLRLFQTDFSKEMRELRRDSRQYYADHRILRIDSNRVFESDNGELSIRPYNLNELQLPIEETKIKAQMAAINNLIPINLGLMEENSSAHLSMCKRLQRTLGDWQSTIDALGSLELYCSYVKDYLDPSADPEIVKACKGNTDIKGQNLKKSELTLLREELAKRSQADANLVFKRYSDLKCAEKLN